LFDDLLDAFNVAPQPNFGRKRPVPHGLGRLHVVKVDALELGGSDVFRVADRASGEDNEDVAILGLGVVDKLSDPLNQPLAHSRLADVTRIIGQFGDIRLDALVE